MLRHHTRNVNNNLKMVLKKLSFIILISTTFLSCTSDLKTETFNPKFIASHINSLNSEIDLLQRSYVEIKKEFSDIPDSIKCIPSIKKQLNRNEENVLNLTQQIDKEISSYSDIIVIKSKEKTDFNPVNLIDSIFLNNSKRLNYNKDSIIKQLAITIESFQKTIDTDCNYKNDWIAYSFKTHFSFENWKFNDNYSQYLKSKKFKWERYIDLLTIKKDILNHHLIILTSLNKK